MYLEIKNSEGLCQNCGHNLNEIKYTASVSNLVLLKAMYESYCEKVLKGIPHKEANLFDISDLKTEASKKITSITKYLGLINQDDDVIKKTGLWAITDLGFGFIKGNGKCPLYILVRNGRVVYQSTETISASEMATIYSDRAKKVKDQKILAKRYMHLEAIKEFINS